MANIKKLEQGFPVSIQDEEYVRLVSQISDLWDDARNKAFQAINSSMLLANWHTGEYIVEFEQKGEARARYGDALLVNLSKDLTRLKGRGFSRSNLTYMRKLYIAFPKCDSLSQQSVEKRQAFVENYCSQTDEKIILNADYTFPSPSAAAAMVVGGSSNGWTRWKDADGKTLDEVYRQK